MTMQAISEKINGIDTDGLKSVMAEVSREPAKGRAKFQVATHWKGGTASETRVRGFELGGKRIARDFTIKTDEPVELLGGNTAPNPQEVLMAGLNACMTVGYVAGCAMHGIELESVSIETEGELDLRGFLGLDASIPPGYRELHYTVRLKGSGSPEQFREVHETVMKTSPNFFNMASPIRMRPTLVVE